MQAGLRHDEPLDAAPDTGHEAERRCIVTGAVQPREDLLRFVVGPDGRLTPDIAGRLPGRGIWVSPERDAIRRAVERKLFQRAARAPLEIPDALDDRIEALLLARCLDLLGLARRAGQAVTGFEKVAAELRQKRAGVLIASSDAAEDGRAKLRRLSPETPEIDCLHADELGRAFGRDRAVHAVLAPGALADKFRMESRRLAGFRRNGRERGLQ